ncbi:hypothetical protein Pogu_2418 [Pyrobaculum oguniense TE7]|uniref:Uncharacterized protein n=1 Tax=Pyrobaculum oguniense (strain DSM 13380 / JCM 10595 / TE7) TaxID=698757 RepID=H6QDA2_PYROT|nr:hypothetical protein Pogu_2418 [Pyrobaculum oguniense TE7]
MEKLAPILLIALGISLIAVYFAIPPKAPFTTTATETITGTVFKTTSTSPSITQTIETYTSTAQTTQPPPQPPSTPPVARPPVLLPLFRVDVVAPDVVNTTRMPIQINYTVVIRNVGNGTGAVLVGGKHYVIDPGKEVKVNATETITFPGTYTLEIEVNGTIHSKTVKVFYYTPVLEAEPVKVNVTTLPTNITVAVLVRNRGNLTAVVEGVKIRPGETRTINKTITVTAAGYYFINIGGVNVPIAVSYYTPNLEWKIGGPEEVEAVPGESYSAWLWLKNTGNATTRLKVDGKEIGLEPGQAVNITKAQAVRGAGQYVVEFKVQGDLNLTVRQAIAVKIVAPKVEIVVWSPRLARSWPQPGATDRVLIHSVQKSLEIQWGYVITTNATKRTVTLVVEGPDGATYYTVRPGGASARNYTLQTQAPGKATVQIKVNGTTYAVEITTELTPPTVTINDVLKIEFTDSRKLEAVQIKCRFGTLQVDVLQVSGVLTYTQTGREISGTITVAHAGGTSTGEFRGSASGNNGQLTLNIAATQINVEFTLSPLKITRVLKDGQPQECDVPLALVPSLLYSGKPVTGGGPATQYAYRLVSAFAKTDSDKPQSAQWNGEYVEVRDRWGNLLKVYFKQREVSIEGALTARLVIS